GERENDVRWDVAFHPEQLAHRATQERSTIASARVRTPRTLSLYAAGTPRTLSLYAAGTPRTLYAAGTPRTPRIGSATFSPCRTQSGIPTPSKAAPAKCKPGMAVTRALIARTRSAWPTIGCGLACSWRKTREIIGRARTPSTIANSSFASVI